MPRKLRVEYAGAFYHVTNRGNRGDPICQDDEDRDRFLVTLAETAAKTGWRVHAFGLLPTHFHLVLETPQPNLVSGMRWFLSTYTNRYNRRHRVVGHIFAGRYRALPIAPTGRYLVDACAHVHLNPARAGLVADRQPLSAYPWGSLGHYLQPPSLRPVWLATHRLLADSQCQDDPAGRREFERAAETRRQAQRPEDWAELRRGWCFGDETFRAALLDRLASGDGIIRHGAAPPEMALRTAERILGEELRRLGWTEAELAARPKGAGEKVEIAARLRRETVLSMRWIAERLRAGSPNTLRNVLHARATAGAPAEPLRRVLRRALIPPATSPSDEAEAAQRASAREAEGFSVSWD